MVQETPFINGWPLRVRVRRRAGALVIDNLFRGASAVGRMLPRARPQQSRIEVIRDIPYLQSGNRAHTLDIYRPLDDGPAPAMRPVVMYVHGGGFRLFSKDSHWLMAMSFARAGYVVFNISYRLAPRFPFPAGLDDTCQAYRWIVENAAQYGGDIQRLVLAGESAGANLVTALTVAACYERPEPFARVVWETGVTPRAVIPACGILQVSDPGRFARAGRLSFFVADRIQEVSESYLRGDASRTAEELAMADPLLVLERGDAPHRRLPPFFVPVGTADPLLDDTRRLKAALDRLSVPCDARYYEGERHAFHAFAFRENARQCWQHTFEFLRQCLEPAGAPPGEPVALPPPPAPEPSEIRSP